MRARRAFFKDDEEGFTTVGAAVALLLVFALVFAGVHVLRSEARSGSVQYVADAGALAAENAVAEFVTAGQAVDAVLLSVGLLGLSAYASSAVAAFVPGGQGVAAKLADAGARVLDLKNAFAKSASKGLSAAQQALGAVCAVRAADAIAANARASGMSCHGFAVPFPQTAAQVALPDTSGIDEAAKAIEEQEPDVEEKVAEQQQLQQQRDDAKRKAWEADCGSVGMNMRERAGHLAGLAGADNPDYASWETWTFSVPLERAKKYYRARQAQEPGAAHGGTPEQVAESVARKRFYAYARETVAKGHVSTSSRATELPKLEALARNTEQVRATSLYTEAVYPVSKAGGTRTIHAYAACPGYVQGSPAGLGCVRELDSGAVERCEHCKFSVTTLGRVPAASTSIDNGFEYYYRIVVEQAEKYRAAAQREEKLRDKLETARKKMTEAFSSALASVASARYDPQPPGRYGCVCVVYAGAEAGASSPFAAAADVPARVAISGAALAADSSCDAGGVITEIGENLLPSEALGSGMVKTVFGAWGKALQAYTDGSTRMVDLLKKGFAALPLVGGDLSQWAADGFSAAAKSAGLQPAKLDVYKPVLVNTAHIAARDKGPAAQVLLGLKSAGQAFGDASVGNLRALAQTAGVSGNLDGLLSDEGLVLGGFDLAALGLGSGARNITMPVPSDLAQRYAQALAPDP